MRRIARCRFEGEEFYALVTGGECRRLVGEPWGRHEVTSQVVPLAQVKLLPPCQPQKIVGVGLNYKDHARELNKPEPAEPVIFLKAVSSLIGPGDAIVIPPAATRIDYEGELAVVMGRRAKNVTPEKALQYVWGYTCVNDVTDRDLVPKDVYITRAKGQDTFCPLGPWVVEGLDPRDLEVKLSVNGQVKQHSRTSQLSFDVPYLISFVSRYMTLFPGDVIMTGTPAGIGPIRPGDEVVVEVEGIGALRNPVVAGT